MNPPGGAADSPGGAADVDPRRVLAEIRATVDLDRALRDLGATGEELPDDPLIGAAVRLVRRESGPPIALAEPITEGRLAASLARFGEGPAGRYVVASKDLASAIRDLAARGVHVSRPADGPFGRSVLVLRGPVAGPHLVLVDPPAGTITPDDRATERDPSPGDRSRCRADRGPLHR